MSYEPALYTGATAPPQTWGPADSVPRSPGVRHEVVHGHFVYTGHVLQLFPEAVVADRLAVIPQSGGDEPRRDASPDMSISHIPAFLFVFSANTSAIGGEGEQVVGRTAESQTFLALAERVGHILSNFRVRDHDSVFYFVLQHEYLISLLQAAPAAIRKHFPFAPLALELVDDPESISRTDLAISINVESYESDAMDRLSALELDWWLDAIQAARDRMFIRFER